MRQTSKLQTASWRLASAQSNLPVRVASEVFTGQVARFTGLHCEGFARKKDKSVFGSQSVEVLLTKTMLNKRLTGSSWDLCSGMRSLILFKGCDDTAIGPMEL